MLFHFRPLSLISPHAALAVTGGGGGVHPGFMVLVALGAAALTGGVVMAANHIIMKKRMHDEVRDIMSTYMPLTVSRQHAFLRGRMGRSSGNGNSNGNSNGKREAC